MILSSLDNSWNQPSREPLMPFSFVTSEKSPLRHHPVNEPKRLVSTVNALRPPRGAEKGPPKNRAAIFKRLTSWLVQGDEHLNHTLSTLKRFQSLSDHRSDQFAPVSPFHRVTGR
jgi:hypothetical protein